MRKSNFLKGQNAPHAHTAFSLGTGSLKRHANSEPAAQPKPRGLGGVNKRCSFVTFGNEGVVRRTIDGSDEHGLVTRAHPHNPDKQIP